jgi:molybdenum cofactor cytidylyltransferase
MPSSLPSVGVVPAAGRSSRFGSDKLLAPLHGEPLVNHTLRSLLDAGLSRVNLIVSCEGALDRAPLAHDDRVKSLVNPDPDRGMFSSIQIGIDAAPDATLFVLPADMPYVRVETIRTLQAAITSSGAVTVPTFRKKRGHPVLIPARYQPFLAAADSEISLKEALLAAQAEVVEIEVDDSGVLRDVDVVGDINDVASDRCG